MFEIGAKLQEQSLANQGKKHKEKKEQTELIKDKNEHRLVFTFERRNGKPVTRVGKFHIEQKSKKEILKLLKKKLACGGKINQEWIELQGDNKDKIKELLEQQGWKFR